MPKILVVEDDHLIRETICEWLGDAGHEVIGVCCGPHAVQVLHTQSNPPQLIISDVEMPGGTDALFETVRNRGLPLLIISGHTTCITTGPQFPTLLKPFGPMALESAVKSLVPSAMETM